MIATQREKDQIHTGSPETSGTLAHSNYSLQTITDFRHLAQLAEEWNRLDAKLESPLQGYIWAKACADSICAQAKPRIIALHAGRQLIAIAAMIAQKGLFSPLQLMGVESLYEPTDFAYRDVNALTALLAQVRKTGSVLVLHRIAANSPTVAAVQQIYKGHAWIFTQPADSCPTIDLKRRVLGQDSIDTIKQLNKGRCSDLRRSQRKAERLGTVTYEVLSPTPALAGELIDEAFEVESKSWKSSAGTALWVDSNRGNFFRKYALAASEQGILRVCFLRIDGKAAAMQIAVEYASRFWLLKIGFDEDFSQISPGNLLMDYTVNYAFASGLSSYEFLGTSDAWTKVWTTSETQCLQIYVYPHNLRGTISLASRVFRKIWMRLKISGN